MSFTTVGIAHPGAMGSAVGAMAKQAGARVRWASAGRSAATADRARHADLEDVVDLARLASGSDVLLSVCPPDAAADVAAQVADTGFAGIYVDANAVAPDTVRRVAGLVGGTARVIDGAIVGPPPAEPGRTRLYLAGPGSAEVAALFEGTALGAVTLEGPVGAASALKACYAAWTKGSTALLTMIRATARHHEVDDALLAEWTTSLPHLPEQATARPRRAAPKGWRFAGEMREIAAAITEAGVPPGALEAFAEVYERLSAFKGAPEAPSLDEVLDAVARPRDGSGAHPPSGARDQTS